MAAPGGQFFIQAKLDQVAPHHESFKQLWETKWKKPAEMGVYPFMFATAKDFLPIVEEMERRNMREPYDWDEYASVFVPKAKELVANAVSAENAGDNDKASEYYLRASAVYRISRFPAPRSPKQMEAWVEGKEACFKGLGLREHPSYDIHVPHTHGLPHEGTSIPIGHHLPASASKANPAPLMIIITGLDGYRTELAVWIEGWRRHGVATAILEIPGTGDSPADPKDRTSPDRVFSSLLDWVDQQGGIDSGKVCAWGFSTGGFYAIRLAHTHAKRLAGVAALGGGCHYMFEPAWLDQVNHLEYPFDLANTLCYKWGYGDDVETFKKEASDKFSLLKDGTLDIPECARLLLVNGTEDEIFPIDDYYLALQHGAPKEVRFVPRLKHMGEPESFLVILKWFYNILGIDGNPGAQLSTLPFQPKYD
ncbi:alpha/beta-hydrolase [Eremomyces bilateralis CBS 781.70]|uniref:Alpha/beta-hydrolase n=1 Tax=Eremomyces bilateralis CBS 781.70 TaxID=1392243 RepID=A0A6G1GDF9_9PEZI|nr:alpha/beta-hydrolase [Eremomyces bilateralis CBS 781.70]KAF1816137.1 alpha/beta-hydrolase [Eremomyces bilateralis CBS 781.70]